MEQMVQLGAAQFLGTALRTALDYVTTVNIFLTDLENNDRMRFPMLPKSIKVQTGTVFQSYSLMAIGGIKLPAGEDLRVFSWEGVLPGKLRQKESYVAEWRDPLEIQSLWSVYRVKKKKLRLLVTETPINHDVYVQDYSVEYMYGLGDYYYKLTLVQAKDLKVLDLSETANADGNSGTTSGAVPAAAGQDRPTPPAAKTRTVGGDDTLWAIAQQVYGNGSDYTKIYEANKDALDAAAKAHGKSDSDNGHWIYAGTVLSIP